MSIRSLFRHLWRSVRKSKDSPDQRLPAAMKPLVMGLAHTQVEELSCDEVYDLLDVYADRISQGEDAAALMPLIQHHLEMCPDCREELNALLRSMEAISA